MNWYLAKKMLPDGREAHVYPLTYGRARLGVGKASSQCFNDEW